VKEKVRAALCQLEVVDDKSANLERARRAVVEAARRGAELVVLPEMFNCPYAHGYFRPYAEPYPEPPGEGVVPGEGTVSDGGAMPAENGESAGGSAGLTWEVVSSAARETGVHLVGGTVPELDDRGRVYNTALFVGPDGRLLAKHRKVHLFDVDIPGGITFRESDTLSAGGAVTVVGTPLGVIGLAVCYDLRFPELARAMVDRGAEILVYPAAFNTTTGPKHWHLLLRARAVDYQVFVLGVSPARHPKSPYQAYGHSLAVDPWGRIAVEAGTGEELLVVELEREGLESARRQIPVLRQRRPDVYGQRQG
jgi:predicted amidohydrolase